MSAYYNEFDPHMAAWLRELIADNLIAPGDVDERSITDVQPSDLDGYTQCHFFAGVGVWSRALRSAGWSDDRPIWTGSCPCQPFSAAGNQKGDSDERHLWPAFFDLIRARNPGVVVGEQVASWQVVGRAGGKSKETDGPAWIDAVQADLAGANYASGFAVFPSAGIGSPHIRLRAWWVAHTDNEGSQGRGERWNGTDQRASGQDGLVDGLADSTGERHDRRWASEASNKQGEIKRPERLCDADWLGCRDGKWRPVEPGLKPLVNGTSKRVVRLRDKSTPENGGRSEGKRALTDQEAEDARDTSEARVMRLKGYGNAINAEAGRVFIESVMELMP